MWVSEALIIIATRILAMSCLFTQPVIQHVIKVSCDAMEEPLSCYNFYSKSKCVVECPSPFVPNIENVCVCPVGSTRSNCEDSK